jgi:hypothetical protein
MRIRTFYHSFSSYSSSQQFNLSDVGQDKGLLSSKEDTSNRPQMMKLRNIFNSWCHKFLNPPRRTVIRTQAYHRMSWRRDSLASSYAFATALFLFTFSLLPFAPCSYPPKVNLVHAVRSLRSSCLNCIAPSAVFIILPPCDPRPAVGLGDLCRIASDDDKPNSKVISRS